MTRWRSSRALVGATILGAVMLAGCGSEDTNASSGSQDQGASGSDQPAQSREEALNDPYSQALREAAETDVDTTKFKAEPPYKLATITQGPINGWGTIFDVVLKKALGDSGKVDMDALIYAAWNGKTENQTRAMDDAIAAQVDGIILTSLSRAGLAASVERATKAGIPVLTCMAGVDSDAYTAEMSRNIPAMGYDSMQAMAEELGGSGKIVMLHGIAGVDAAEFWKLGAEAALKAYPDIEVVSEQYANWSVADATTVMRTVLAQNPQIDGVWVGGLEMGSGVVNAFAESGRPVPFIAGTNPINGFLRLADEQGFDFFAAPFPPGASKECAGQMINILEGKSVKKFTDVSDLIDGTAPYGTGELDDWYVPELNDDFIVPLGYPAEFFASEGFARD